MARRVRGRAQRRRGPPGLVPLDGRLRRRQGPHLPAGAAGLRLQRRRPRDRAAGARGRRRGGCPRDRLHPRACRPSAWSASSTTSWSTGRSSSERATSAAELCTVDDLASPAPARRRQRAGGGRAGPGPRRVPGRGPRRAARLPPRRAPDRHGRDGRTASTGSTTPRPPTRTPPGRRCGPTTRSCGSPAGWPRAPASTTWSAPWRDRLRGVVLLGRDRHVIADALARHAPEVPVVEVADEAATGADARRPCAPRPTWPEPGTPCCWRRAAPRWTCSPTTPPAATPSRPPSGRSAVRLSRPRHRPSPESLADTRRICRGNAALPAGETCRSRHGGPADRSASEEGRDDRPRTRTTRERRRPAVVVRRRAGTRSTGRSRPTTCCSWRRRCCSPSAWSWC